MIITLFSYYKIKDLTGLGLFNIMLHIHSLILSTNYTEKTLFDVSGLSFKFMK